MNVNENTDIKINMHFEVLKTEREQQNKKDMKSILVKSCHIGKTVHRARN